MPLTGVKVLDLTRVLSGPFCTALLGDLGADIIKVEAPEGDLVRSQGAVRDGLSWYFAQFNRNKRSLRLDLRKPEAKRHPGRLIERSDVLVENFRPGVLARLGFDDARLQRLAPVPRGLLDQRLRQHRPVQGPPGVRFHRPGHERIHERQRRPGRSADALRPADQRPRRRPLCRAQHRRRRAAARATGQGQRAEVSLTNGLVSLLAYIATQHFATGTAPPRSGNDHPIAAPYGPVSDPRRRKLRWPPPMTRSSAAWRMPSANPA